MNKDEMIEKYSEVFERHGFGGNSIDFSDVEPEAIEAMALALLALEAKKKLALRF